MSVCTFIASDFPLKEVSPVQDYPLEINLRSVYKELHADHETGAADNK